MSTGTWQRGRKFHGSTSGNDRWNLRPTTLRLLRSAWINLDLMWAVP